MRIVSGTLFHIDEFRSILKHNALGTVADHIDIHPTFGKSEIVFDDIDRKFIGSEIEHRRLSSTKHLFRKLLGFEKDEDVKLYAVDERTIMVLGIKEVDA